MKKTICLCLLLNVTFSNIALAQTSTVTRSEVKEDLLKWEQAGYKPFKDKNAYPDNAQKVHKKLWNQDNIQNTMNQ